MTIRELIVPTGTHYQIECPCGFTTPGRATMEAAGRDIDVHLAEQFRLPSTRRFCPGPVPLSRRGILRPEDEDRTQ